MDVAHVMKPSNSPPPTQTSSKEIGDYSPFTDADEVFPRKEYDGKLSKKKIDNLRFDAFLGLLS